MTGSLVLRLSSRSRTSADCCLKAGLAGGGGWLGGGGGGAITLLITGKKVVGSGTIDITLTLTAEEQLVSRASKRTNPRKQEYLKKLNNNKI